MRNLHRKFVLCSNGQIYSAVEILQNSVAFSEYMNFKVYRDILNIYKVYRKFFWSEGWTVLTETIVLYIAINIYSVGCVMSYCSHWKFFV